MAKQNNTREELTALNDALTSLNANLKANFSKQANIISDASKTISKDFTQGIDDASKSLDQQDKILASINRNKDQS